MAENRSIIIPPPDFSPSELAHEMLLAVYGVDGQKQGNWGDLKKSALEHLVTRNLNAPGRKFAEWQMPDFSWTSGKEDGDIKSAALDSIFVMLKFHAAEFILLARDAFSRAHSLHNFDCEEILKSRAEDPAPQGGFETRDTGDISRPTGEEIEKLYKEIVDQLLGAQKRLALCHQVSAQIIMESGMPFAKTRRDAWDKILTRLGWSRADRDKIRSAAKKCNERTMRTLRKLPDMDMISSPLSLPEIANDADYYGGGYFYFPMTHPFHGFTMNGLGINRFADAMANGLLTLVLAQEYDFNPRSNEKFLAATARTKARARNF